MPELTPASSPLTGYATLSDLSDYLDTDLSDLASECQRLLYRASEHVDYLTQGRIDTDDDDHVAAALTATCAQVEFWLAEGEDVAFRAPLTSRTVGRVSESYGAGGSVRTGPRCHQVLALAGLLYAGAGIR